MTHKIVHTSNYLLIVDTSKTDPLDSSKIGDPIAHLPLNGSPILEGVDLLPPYSRHQEDGIDKKSIDFVREVGGTEQQRLAFKDGYLEAIEKYKYTEEDVVHLLHKTARKYFQEGREYKGNMAIAGDPLHGVRRELMNMVQSLHQYPTEFECEMVDFTVTKEVDYSITYSEHEPKPKTITTAQGVQWVGKYK
jgi:hypothetical protein